MKLTFWTRLNGNKTNTRMNISNMPTHVLLKMYHSGTRMVNEKYYQGRVEHYMPVARPLTKPQRQAIYNLLRLRFTKRGSLKAVL